MVTPTKLDRKLVPKILKIINKLGKTMDFKVPDSKDYDPDTGITTETSVTTYSKKVSPPEPYIEGYVPNESIKLGDTKVYLPASGLEFTPNKGYLVEFDGTKWRMEFVNPVYTGELIGMYELLLRK